MSKIRRNEHWLTMLEEMCEDEEPDSNKYYAFKKALNSLKEEPKEYTDPDSLLAVKFIGPTIVARLNKTWNQASGSSNPMGEIREPLVVRSTSSLPSPPKRKRPSKAASTSTSKQPKKRGRPPKKPPFEYISDDEPEILPATRRRVGPSLDVPELHSRQQSDNLQRESHSRPVYTPPLFDMSQYPMSQPQPTFGTPQGPFSSQNTYQYHSVNIHATPPAPRFQFDSYQHHGYAQSFTRARTRSPSLSQHHDSHQYSLSSQTKPRASENNRSIDPAKLSFDFYYIDPDGNHVQNQDSAGMEVFTDTLWHKICFLDLDVPKDHPVREKLRLPPPSRKGKKREEIVEAWISDEVVEQFGLQTAPGFAPIQPDASASSLISVASSSPRLMTMTTSFHSVGAQKPPSNPSQNSLEDLLNAEKKKKNTIDPARLPNIDRQWDVRKNGFGPANQQTGVKAEEPHRSQKHNVDQEKILETAMERNWEQVSSTTSMLKAENPREVSSSRPVASETTAGPSLFKKQISSQDFNISPLGQPPSLSTSTSFQFTSTQQLSSRYIPPVLSLPVVTPAPTPVAPTVNPPKAKGKGKTRGRISDFVPAPPAVDEFDMDLDRQAASHQKQTDERAIASASHTSADLIDNIMDITQHSARSFPKFDPIVFPPGSFDIVMILDNREVKSHKHRDHIYVELQKKGVHVEQRSLVLGDVLWIARRKVPNTDAANNECVLGYVLERKRLDDLCGSIKEGRFHEQKFRLTNTGLKVFYLIEDYEVEKHREFFGVQIDTARSSIQIVDGFILKETRKLSYTIDYLATMHETIRGLYQLKPLHIIPPVLVKRHSYLALQKYIREQQPKVEHLTSYHCYDALNNKSANLTTRDLLAQMLLCVKGVSAEKAATIIKNYPTMRSLWDAFREAEKIERAARLEEEMPQDSSNGRRGKKKIPEAKVMLCALESPGRQNIGPVLSAKIHRLLRARSYED